jgi:hypothetical protein
MRLPWQRRVAGRVDVETAVAPAPLQHAWRKLPALHGGIDTKPPLTAGSVELADALSRRLRSTGERPRLIHRAGLPDAASPGTVRGLAAASGESGASRTSRSEPRAHDDAEQQPEIADGNGVTQSTRPRVVARRRSGGLTTAADAARAAAVTHVVDTEPAAAIEVPDLGADRLRAEDVIPPSSQPALQRTVIRRRPGSAAPRPLGLQAPLTVDETRQAAIDASNDQHDEAGMPRHETAPRAVAATVGRLHRSDVTDVRVRRDREAELLAASEHARAVTRGGEVFIPASEGRLDSGPGSGLLAHELTHVIQQRRLGRSVPLEHSPAGRRLEADAAMTERHVRGDLGAPAPQPTAAEQPPPAVTAAQPAGGDDRDDAATAREIQDELVASGRAFRMPDGSLVFPGGGGHLPEQRVSPAQSGVAIQRAPEEPSPADSPSSELLAAPDAAAGPVSWSFPAPAPDPQRGAARSPFVAEPASTMRQTSDERAASPPTTLAPAPATPPDAGGTVPVTEEAAPIDLDDLARRVYGQVRTQLRSELLIDRERAGLLTDFR